jgi:hypothetical protein
MIAALTQFVEHIQMSDQNTPKPVRGRPFPPGTSGNDAGRPRGSKNRATRLWEQLSDANAEEIMHIVLDLALSGDKQMLRMCLDRLVPRQRERLVSIELPPVNSAADRAAVIDAIRTAQAGGEITISEAERMIGLVDVQIEAIEMSHFAVIADELQQSRGSGIARLVPQGSEGLAEHNGAPANDISDASAANDSAREAEAGGTLPGDSAVPKNNGTTEDPASKTSADNSVAERGHLRRNGSPSSSGGPSTADDLSNTDESDSDGISSEDNPANPVECDPASKVNGASAPDDGEWHEAAD